MRHQPVLQRSVDRAGNSDVKIMSSKMPEQELYRLATNRVAKKKGVYIHFAVYLAVTALSVVIWFVTGHPGDSFSWFVFLFSVIAAYSEYELTYP